MTPVPTRSAVRRRSGTTVLELLVALVVTGAVAAAGAAAFRQTIERRSQLLTRSANTERAAAARALLREWLAAGTVTWPPGSSGLSFTTTAATPAGAAGVPLRLYVDDDARTPEEGLTLEFRPSPQKALTRREIDASIQAMTVEYLDADARAWRTAESVSATRPLAVRLTFPTATPRAAQTLADDDRLRLVPLTIVLPTAGASAALPVGSGNTP